MKDSIPATTSASILVVEDEGIVAKDIQNRLITMGYAVPLTVATGQAAVDAAEKHRPNLVLMDIMLRGDMDGIEAAEQIRSRLDIPIIYLTAYSDENTLRRAKVTEPFGYVLKPFTERELLTSIEMALYKHRMDTRLKQSEYWLTTTLHSIGDAVISTDNERNVQFMNVVAEQLTGWLEADAIGQNLDVVYRLDTTPDADAHDAEADSIVWLVARDGRRIPVETNSSPIRDSRGATLGIVLVFRDISEHLDSQRDLRSQLDLYENLLRAQSQMGEGFGIVRGVRLVYVNDAFTAITGYSEEELLALESPLQIAVPAEREMLKHRMLLRLKNEEVPARYETALVHKSGRHVDIEVAAKQFGVAPDVRIVMIVRDISERKRSQAELLRTQLRLATLFKNLPSIVLYETGGGREFISENIEQLLGYPVAQFLEDREMFPRIMHPDDAAEVKEALKSWHQSNEPGPLTYQFRARRSDGSYVWLEDHMVEVKPSNGSKYMTGVMIDITERKRVEEELRLAKEKAEEYDRLKTNFISVISHEIRTPLNAILGCTKLVRNAVHDGGNKAMEEGLQEYFSIVDRSGVRLMKLIESFLDIAGIQAGNLKLKLVTMPVELVVRQAVDELRLKISEANLNLIEEYDAIHAIANIDAERLAQIVTNVLANAVKFTPHGSITVRTMQDKNKVSIVIEDSGIGIAPSFLPNIFTPFRQGSEGSTRGYQGAGLGLSIAHRLTDSMGGAIEVSSIEGTGTKITIRFPIVADEPVEWRAVPADEGTERPDLSSVGSGRRALVVEDDYENLMYIRTVLRTTGWIVTTATNGDDALQSMSEQLPHVVLMDINLVGAMSGFEALEVIRKNAAFAHIPVIAVTAHAFEDVRQQIIAAGFDDYLAKPFTPDQLREVLVKHLLKQHTTP